MSGLDDVRIGIAMYFTAFILSLIGIACSCGVFLCICKCLRWCDDERWEHPMRGDYFSDGRE
jgi:hypothetical protein